MACYGRSKAQSVFSCKNRDLCFCFHCCSMTYPHSYRVRTHKLISLPRTSTTTIIDIIIIIITSIRANFTQSEIPLLLIQIKPLNWVTTDKYYYFIAYL